MNEYGITSKKIVLILVGAFLLLSFITCATVSWKLRRYNQFSDLAEHGMTKGKRGDYYGAIQDLDRYLSLRQDYQIYLARAVMKRGKDDFAGAIEDCNSALSMSPQNPMAYALRGWCKGGRGDFTDGLDDCNKALQIDPESTFAYSVRGEINGLMGNFEQGIQDCTIALDFNSRFPQTYSGRARIYLMSGQLTEAVSDCNLVLSLDPNLIEGYLTRALSNYLSYAFDEALNDCNRALSKDPLNSLIYTMRAQVKSSKGEIDEAIADCDRALNLVESSLAYGTRAQSRRLKGDYAGALADAEKALAAGPDNSDAHFVRAYCQHALGNETEAVAAADTAIQLSFRSADFNTATLRAMMRMVKNEPEKALEDCNAALALYGEYAMAHAVRGQVNQALGNKKAASADFQWVLDHPSDYEARKIAEEGLSTQPKKQIAHNPAEDRPAKEE